MVVAGVSKSVNFSAGHFRRQRKKQYRALYGMYLPSIQDGNHCAELLATEVQVVFNSINLSLAGY